MIKSRKISLKVITIRKMEPTFDISLTDRTRTCPLLCNGAITILFVI